MKYLFLFTLALTAVFQFAAIAADSSVSASASTNDLAQAKFRERWLHHPIVGDPSWDTFQREPGNPIYVGKAPFVWPVNGFLFRDPPSNRWYVYVALCPRGYWPPPAAKCSLMREKKEGGWEDLGDVLAGDPTKWDGDGKAPGAIPDVSVVFDGGRYHMLYDWCDPKNNHGGLAYAWADKPEGPFHRADKPISDEVGQKPLLGRYVRTYAGTLVKRKNDWLALFMMSTHGNAGGTWAMAAMSAPKPEGPYSDPVLLLYPQSDVFHPALAEFYPAFAHDGFVYAPATSVAANRTFQIVYRARLDEALKPEAWSIFQYGSVCHRENAEYEAAGIWGQTFSRQVAPDGMLRVMYPAKNSADVGTINMMQRKFDQPYKDGFVLSAPAAPACAILRENYSDFRVQMKIRASGTWAFGFGCASPIGPDRHTADARINPLMRKQRHEFRQNGSSWSIANDTGDIKTGALKFDASKAASIEIEYRDKNLRVIYDGAELFSGALAAGPGRIELYAETHALLSVDEFKVSGTPSASTESLLALDALAGAAAGGGEWQNVNASSFRYGTGCLSSGKGARAKWNVFGRGFKLWAPKGPEYGSFEVLVDGIKLGEVVCKADQALPSAMVLERKLEDGPHAIVVRALSAKAPLDVLVVDAPEPAGAR